MKLKLLLIFLVSFFCLKSFSQEDPLDKIKKPKSEKEKDEQKLTGKGRAEFAKAKNELKNIPAPKFEISANEVMNQDDKELLGVPSNQTPDMKLSGKQNEDNKKNEKAIKEKLKKDAKDANIEVDMFVAPKSGKKTPLAASFWNPSWYTPVKNQGGCGSCWAFAAAAAFEHTYRKFYGSVIDLSEQDIVACGQTCGFWGLFKEDAGSCSGGWSDKAFDYLKCTGVASEGSYPYTATSGPCISKPKYKKAYTWGQLYPGRFPTATEVKNYINAYGSVVSYMKAGISTFYGYGYGVYNGYPSNSSNSIDHAVTIVGWNDYVGAWIIKNSWGTGWGGYGGYAYVGYNQCNLAKYVYWVYPNP